MGFIKFLLRKVANFKEKKRKKESFSYSYVNSEDKRYIVLYIRSMVL